MSNNQLSLEGSEEADYVVDLRRFSSLVKSCEEDLRFWEQEFKNYLEVCSQEDYIPDAAGVHLACQQFDFIKTQISELNNLLSNSESDREFPIMENLQILRAIHIARSTLIKALGWVTAPYLQSIHAWTFPVSSLGGLGERYNYPRSPSLVKERLAACWKKVLGLDADSTSLVLTSSGMSAFSLIENYLMSEVLQPQALIYAPRFTYQESNMLFFRNQQVYREVMEDLDDEIVIARRIVELQPDVVMLESLQNGVATRILNIELILSQIDQSALKKRLYIMIDDSLAPGICNPLKFNSDKLTIFYSFSASKYLQLGLDIDVAGAVALDSTLSARISELCTLGGYNISDMVAAAYPQFEKSVYLDRQRRLTRNGLIIAEKLDQSAALEGKIKVDFPLLASSFDYEYAKSLPWSGGLVTLDFVFHRGDLPALNMRVYHNWCEKLISDAKRSGVEIACSESFGFCATRVNAMGWCFESNMPAFVRISPGEESLMSIKKVASLIEQSLVEYVTEYEQHESGRVIR